MIAAGKTSENKGVKHLVSNQFRAIPSSSNQTWENKKTNTNT